MSYRNDVYSSCLGKGNCLIVTFLSIIQIFYYLLEGGNVSPFLQSMDEKEVYQNG